MTPFDYDKARAAAERGEKIYQCRDPEWEADVLAWDMGGDHPLAVRRRKRGDSRWVLESYTNNGLCVIRYVCPFDLVMKPTTKTVYVRLQETLPGSESPQAISSYIKDYVDREFSGGKWISDIVAIDVKE